MPFRFATIREMSDDLVVFVEGMVDANNDSLFAGVSAYRYSNWANLSKIVSNTTRSPAAIIVPGPGDHDKAAARTIRTIDFYLFVITGMFGERDMDNYAACDLTDIVIQKFHPQIDDKAYRLRINNVVYEPASFTPVTADDHIDAMQITIEAIDSCRTDRD